MKRSTARLPRRPVVGRILSIKPHPRGDFIRVTSVDVGLATAITIVVGGDPFPSVGDLVPVALPGTRMANGKKIRPRNFRKVRSNGNILSAEELDWDQNGLDAVLVLPPAAFAVGMPVFDRKSYDSALVEHILRPRTHLASKAM